MRRTGKPFKLSTSFVWTSATDDDPRRRRPLHFRAAGRTHPSARRKAGRHLNPTPLLPVRLRLFLALRQPLLSLPLLSRLVGSPWQAIRPHDEQHYLRLLAPASQNSGLPVQPLPPPFWVICAAGCFRPIRNAADTLIRPEQNRNGLCSYDCSQVSAPSCYLLVFRMVRDTGFEPVTPTVSR